ncbi:helix-turn-helix transcriptional regulator [Flavobacterium sp. LS1R47]|jgi:transcriptional regulator with XRE-family HTH domain|uniref:Helix-turn-helix transcriptional regulator n=1 Tax=Flavobacterium frigoritolerans TaxID=2987686 RepID=A0A9X2ZL96_9FLAO|nr:helix-turn-helix transcriptional regulator [Flavobacterium frigoritolerans]MCV9930767.1 helix-turn-helix transcriptional regulator [Flavobacterium frigoritolerans]
MKEKLLNARLNKGLSQEELAYLIGMTQSNYSRRERGLKKISDYEWIQIAKHLEVKEEDIYELDTPNEDRLNINHSIETESFIIPSFVIELIELLKAKIKKLEDQVKKYED